MIKKYIVLKSLPKDLKDFNIGVKYKISDANKKEYLLGAFKILKSKENQSYTVHEAKDGDELVTKTRRVEKHLIKRSSAIWPIIDEYSFRSKNVYNATQYLVRNVYFDKEDGDDKKTMSEFMDDLQKTMQPSDEYISLTSQSAQEQIKQVKRDWSNYWKALKAYKQTPELFTGKPMPPGYKQAGDSGRTSLMLKNTQFQIKDGYVRFSWEPLRPLNNKIKSLIPNGCKISEAKFVPSSCGGYRLQISYVVEIREIYNANNRTASIDPGVTNFVTLVNNFGIEPFAIKGGVPKSINQFYNKELARMKSDLEVSTGKKSSKRLGKLHARRNRKMEDFMHKASKSVIDWCKEHEVGTLVMGKNKNQKQNINMGKVQNQNAVQIPYNQFSHMLSYKCESAGIKYIENEESFTSKASFLDMDYIPTYGEYEKGVYNFSGKRKIGGKETRGLYASGDGTIINADVNGAYNIMRKAIPNALDDCTYNMGLHPVIMKIM